MARKMLSNILSGTMSGAGSAAPASAMFGPAAAPWILGGGAALGALSGLLGEDETASDKLSRQLMGEQLEGLRINNREARKEMANKRKLEARNKAISSGLGNLMRGANIARNLGGF